jgi:virulence-associated protein VapD
LPSLSISLLPILRTTIRKACRSQAYADIAHTLAGFGFDRVQGSLYTTPSEDLANLFGAIMALKAMPWLPPSVRDIRAFRVEQWSDFTRLVKS